MDTSTAISLLKKHQQTFHPVVPFDAAKNKLIAFDFTVENESLAITLNSTASFTGYINDQLNNAGARYGIGGYAEHRTVYSSSKVFDAERSGEEPRRLHLGTDIWGKQNTPVIAPLDSVVHSFAFNNRFGDYGATIILSHNLEGISFHTLYGHLSLNSIKNIQEGENIKKGDWFADFGIPSENGSWPPHLHFQIILDMGKWKGDYPGVCKFSEKEKWLSNSPDPDIILQMNRYVS